MYISISNFLLQLLNIRKTNFKLTAMYSLRKASISIILFIIPFLSHATHIVGGGCPILIMVDPIILVFLNSTVTVRGAPLHFRGLRLFQ